MEDHSSQYPNEDDPFKVLVEVHQYQKYETLYPKVAFRSNPTPRKLGSNNILHRLKPRHCDYINSCLANDA